MKDLHGINLTKLTDEQMCREKLQTEVIRNVTDLILKFSEAVISIADETIPKTSTNPNTQENHGLMMIVKTPSKIAKRPNDSSENILHPTTSAISASSGRELEEH